MNAVETENLTKNFDGFTAVDHIDLTIDKGELFGLLGPNGAGKTTLVHMLSTVLSISEGEAYIYGDSVIKNPNKVRSSIGIVFQDPSSDEQLTGRENLDFHGRMYGVPQEEREKKSLELLEMVDLKDRADDLVREYSGGMRRRLELARGFLHEPKVLFLDEPTLGLVPQTRRNIWSYIEKLNEEEGITMVLTTHYMEEADYLCDRVGIIDNGKIISLGEPSRLKKELKGDVVNLEIENGEKFAELLKEVDFVKEVNSMNGTLQLSVDDGEDSIPKILTLVQKKGGEVKSVGLRKPTLEDVFINQTGRRIREERAEAKDRQRMKRRARR